MFKYAITPKEWTSGVIFPVPKGEVTWDASITNTRPITLLEIPRKIALKLLTSRLSNILTNNDILRGRNPSALPGTSTNEVIYQVHQAMEHARENNNEMWIVLQDMRRAFDSVDNEALQRALKRIKLPQQYIDLYQFINENRTNRLITAYGLTEPYTTLSQVSLVVSSPY
jgi:hypothetical protein